MRIGLMLPAAGGWFDREAIARICPLVEEMGFSALRLGDHVVAPTEGAPDQVGVEPLWRWDGGLPWALTTVRRSLTSRTRIGTFDYFVIALLLLAKAAIVDNLNISPFRSLKPAIGALTPVCKGESMSI